MSSRIIRSAATACLALASCGDAPVDTPVAIASTHFRYHAQFWQSDLGGLRASLEANRADVYDYLALDDEAVVDYYLLNNHAELARHCSDEPTCSVNGSVFTQYEIDHHNLIHAYLAKAGLPPRPIREGIAEAVDCYRESNHGPYDPGLSGWRELFQPIGSTGPSAAFYVSSMRLVRLLLLRFGPLRFMTYYGSAADTNDPEVFAGSFVDFWGLSIDDAWSAANAIGDAPPRPICPCRAPAMAPDGPQQWVFGTTYAPLAAPPNSLLTLELPFSAPDEHTLLDCDGASSPALLAAEYQKGVNLIHLDDGSYYMLSEFSGGGQPELKSGGALSEDCSTAGTLALDYAAQRIGIVVPRGSPASYVKITAPQTESITRVSNTEGGFRICSDCSLSDCAAIPPAPEFDTLPPSIGALLTTKGAVLEVDTAGLSGVGLVSFIGKLVLN